MSEKLDPQALEAAFQHRVQPWMMACFGPEISGDKLERSDRFIEEALELAQSGDYPRERVLALVDYVYGRAQGDMPQEVGGVMVTLAAFCLAHDIDMHEAGETELARVWTKVEKIRAKHAAKPTGSALPVAARRPVEDELVAALEPFAELADAQLKDGGPIMGHYLHVKRVPIAFGGEHDIKPADLRRARDLIARYRERNSQ